MKPMIERNGNKVTLNLAKPLLVWTGFWLVMALLFDSVSVFFVGISPFIFLFCFWLAFIAAFACFMFFCYLRGDPITLTTPRGGKRVVRRANRR